MKGKDFTIREIKACQPEVEGSITQLFHRNCSPYLTKLFLKTSLKPNDITIISFLFLIISAVLLSTGKHFYLIIFGFLLQLSVILDSCDGEVARLKNIRSAKGAWFDPVLDRLGEFVLFLALGIGIYNQTADPFVWLYIFLSFSALFITHTLIFLTSKCFGKEKLAKTHSQTFLSKLSKLTGIKPYHLAIGQDIHMIIFSLAAIFNKLMWINYFFIIIQNMYWITIFLLIYLKKE